MDDAISRKGTSAWLENMGYSYPAKVIMDEKRFPPVLGTNLAEVGTDCISRQQAIDAMAELQGRASTKAELKGISKAWKRIKQLPPIQPKRGWWIEIINSRGVVVALRCSRCEKSPRHGVRSDFCPHCGAKMEVTE